MTRLSPLLLDTCAAIWFADDLPIANAAINAMNEAFAANVSAYVSPISPASARMYSGTNRKVLSPGSCRSMSCWTTVWTDWCLEFRKCTNKKTVGRSM